MTRTAAEKNTAERPLILLPSCLRGGDGGDGGGDEDARHSVGHKYVEAARLAGGLPLVVPGISSRDAARDLDALLRLADGVLLTGSPSNVHPSHFDEAVRDPALPLDPGRDAFTLALIPRALALGLPLLAICRGTQEVNVALGGSLHQAVHTVEGCLDHRASDDLARDEAYGPAHEVLVQPGGRLESLVGTTPFQVNSLHGQAVRRPAPGLRVEALAPDGVVEAFSIAGAPGFNLCVQWHPEWRAADNPVSMALLGAFGQACRDYRRARIERA